MKLRITEAVLAEAYRAKVCRERMEELAESIVSIRTNTSFTL